MVEGRGSSSLGGSRIGYLKRLPKSGGPGERYRTTPEEMLRLTERNRTVLLAGGMPLEEVLWIVADPPPEKARYRRGKPRPCVNCGVVFTPPRKSDRIACSKACHALIRKRTKAA